MTERPYLPAMNDPDLHTPMVAQGAAEGLLALGWPVRSAGDDLETWLIGLAVRRGIRPAVERVQ